MIYEYKCDSCGKKLEMDQSINDEPLKMCSNCGHCSLMRQISVCSFVLKGESWAKDGYSSKKK